MAGVLSTGEGGIRTHGTGYFPYNGLAIRRLKPLGHLSWCAATTSVYRPTDGIQAKEPARFGQISPGSPTLDGRPVRI